MEKQQKFEEILKTINELIRSGNANLARTQLQELANSKIPREYKFDFAALARRADLAHLCVRLLNPIVRPADQSPSTASEDERAEYAGGLIKLGAVSEAETLLKGIDSSKSPRALLYLAFAHFARWNYAESIPILKRYTDSSGIDDYQKLVGKVNLAAAYVHERQTAHAVPLLRELRKELKNRSLNLLLSNILQYWAELEIGNRDFDSCERYLIEAKQTLGDKGSLDSFFIKKWRAISAFIQSPGKKSTRNELLSVRQDSVQKQHWETARDCDHYLAIHSKDEELFTYLYFGTHYESLRAHYLQEWNGKIDLPQNYSWSLRPGNSTPISLFQGELKEGQLLYRLAATLISDFYRPFRLAEIHAALFPSDYYNPITSPLRVHQAIHRFRNWGQKKFPVLFIEEEKKNYRFSAERACSLLVPLTNMKKSNFELALDKLERHFTKSFSTEEAKTFLDVSHNWALKILQNGITSGILTRTGKGPACRYQFISKEILKKAA